MGSHIVYMLILEFFDLSENVKYLDELPSTLQILVCLSQILFALFYILGRCSMHEQKADEGILEMRVLKLASELGKT